MKIKNGPTSITNSMGTMTTMPRSWKDKLLGRSTTQYSRPAPTMRLAPKFKAKPSSNGIGVGM